MAIGNVKSKARGSGARYNDGKPAMELIPFRLLLGTIGAEVAEVMEQLAAWQEGEDSAAELALDLAAGRKDYGWEDCARVFEYGRKKYASWNWAKGMPWSVPAACAVRHLLAIDRGEELDPESGLPHWGHVMCNLVMLATFVDTYTEGDDRPEELRRAN